MLSLLRTCATFYASQITAVGKKMRVSVYSLCPAPSRLKINSIMHHIPTLSPLECDKIHCSFF